MTIHSHTHYLLLKQLGIIPLAARTEFFVPLTAPHYQPIPASRFADDVNTILSQTSLRNWQIDINASQCQITEQTLITPPLPLLQQASQKRQLWLLLAGYLDA